MFAMGTLRRPGGEDSRSRRTPVRSESQVAQVKVLLPRPRRARCSEALSSFRRDSDRA